MISAAADLQPLAVLQQYLTRATGQRDHLRDGVQINQDFWVEPRKGALDMQVGEIEVPPEAVAFDFWRCYSHLRVVARRCKAVHRDAPS